MPRPPTFTLSTSRLPNHGWTVNGREGTCRILKRHLSCSKSRFNIPIVSASSISHSCYPDSRAHCSASPTLQSSQAHPCLGPSALFAASHSPASHLRPRHRPDDRPSLTRTLTHSSISPSALPFSTLQSGHEHFNHSRLFYPPISDPQPDVLVIPNHSANINTPD